MVYDVVRAWIRDNKAFAGVAVSYLPPDRNQQRGAKVGSIIVGQPPEAFTVTVYIHQNKRVEVEVTQLAPKG